MKFFHRIKLNALLIPFGKSASRSARGMSIIEIIIVIALIGTIMTVIINQVMTAQDNAMRDTTRIAMQKIGQSLQIYRVHNHVYPNTEQGLEALVSSPADARRWRGPYIEASKLNDPWGTPFEFESDGRNYKIMSAGPNLQMGDQDDVVYPEDNPNGVGGEG